MQFKKATFMLYYIQIANTENIFYTFKLVNKY